jgi:hypothetical protein
LLVSGLWLITTLSEACEETMKTGFVLIFWISQRGSRDSNHEFDESNESEGGRDGTGAGVAAFRRVIVKLSRRVALIREIVLCPSNLLSPGEFPID